MTEADRRIAAFAATFAKERAPALLARLGTDSAGEAVRLAARLAAAPRTDRLQALAVAMTARGAAAGIDAATALERPRVALVLVAVAAGAPPPRGSAPLLVRVCRERVGR